MNPIQTEVSAGTVKRVYAIPSVAERKEQAKLSASIVAPVPPAARNDLGAHHHERGPSIQPTLRAFVQIHADELADSQEISELAAAHDQLHAEQRLSDEHSQPLVERKIASALTKYSVEPTEENLTALRHAKSFDPSEHAVIQFESKRRRQGIVDRIAPTCRNILNRASATLSERAQRLGDADSAAYSDLGLESPGHPLVNGLRILARNLANEAKANQLGGVPELIHELLKHDAAMKASLAKGSKK